MAEKKKKSKELNKRYFFIDFIRGICLASMIAYHTVWDLSKIFGVNIEWFGTDFSALWQKSISWTFIFLSGFCLSMSKKRFKRGLIVSAAGVIITAVTYVFMPEDIIIFGVLTLIGASMLLTDLIKPVMKKLPPILGALLSFIIFIFTYEIKNGYIGTKNLLIYRLPRNLYSNYFSTFFGFKFKGFVSADYFPFLPWFFLFLTGFFVFCFLEKQGFVKRWKKTAPKKELFSTMGRYSLWIYMAHQPVIYGVLYIYFNLIK